MRYCPACHHHHGGDNNQWPSCQGLIYDEVGGIRRCHCTSPEPHHTT